ncbi:hypothetical protein CAEBREN_00050 [Caenorhabditis brenneri]|uniref:Uncharacterized protein n=1 Tax=Caenorhabditis brenneri TaxID=135651 RepID=G0N292_CAEBE|nr:hypothetical protein CAEBREN_00050 [Caenorhabditis brenneri]
MVVNIPVFLTIWLYIPILISIQKLTSISSNTSHPQKFIFWQILTVLAMKIVILLVLFFIADLPTHKLIILFRVLDSVVSPLIIQMSYLGCNQRNLKTLLEVMKPLWRSNTQVRARHHRKFGRGEFLSPKLSGASAFEITISVNYDPFENGEKLKHVGGEFKCRVKFEDDSNCFTF